MRVKQETADNLLLRALNVDDFKLIQPELEAAKMPLHERIIERGHKISHVWFLDNAVASIVATTPNGRKAEVALIGCEGLVDLGASSGADTSPFECFIQVPGHAWRLPVGVLRVALRASPTMRETFNRFTQAFIVQISYTALVNSTYTIDQRLARWLLMAHDRLIGDEIAITHQSLSLMLGIRRAGATTTVRKLQRAGLIKAGRSLICVVDRAGLEALAADAYGCAETEYERLTGVALRRYSSHLDQALLDGPQPQQAA